MLKKKHKEHYLNFVLLPPHWAPPYPLPWVPLLPILHPPVLPIFNASMPAAHSEKRRKREAAKVSQLCEKEPLHTLEVVRNILQVPDDYVVKHTHASKFQPSRMPFWIWGKFQVFLDT